MILILNCYGQLSIKQSRGTNKPRGTLGRTGFVTFKAGTQQTIRLLPYVLSITERNYSTVAQAASKQNLILLSAGPNNTVFPNAWEEAFGTNFRKKYRKYDAGNRHFFLPDCLQARQRCSILMSAHAVKL